MQTHNIMCFTFIDVYKLHIPNLVFEHLLKSSKTNNLQYSMNHMHKAGANIFYLTCTQIYNKKI